MSKEYIPLYDHVYLQMHGTQVQAHSPVDSAATKIEGTDGEELRDEAGI